jgi:hypothetical protein
LTVQDYFRNISRRSRKFVFLGGSGSGKSETAIAFAFALSQQVPQTVHFFDMDQSKPVYRSRDVKEGLLNAGVRFHASHELMDAPTVPAGVVSCLQDERSFVLMDIGGNEMGAVNIGQYKEFILQDDSLVYFVVNCYRPFFGSASQLAERVGTIRGLAGVKRLSYVMNPYWGSETTPEDFYDGCGRTGRMLEDLSEKPVLAVAPEELPIAHAPDNLPLLRIKRHFFYGG